MNNNIIKAIEKDRELDPDTPFQGDAKCQVTVDLDEPPYWESVKKILISACHRPGQLDRARDSLFIILARLGAPEDVDVFINPAGEWTIGGPLADCGLTGRKIVCDQYGGYCPVGGGAFSGKDPSKVDRSAAYAARYIAKNMVAAGVAREMLVQVSYAIGVARPLSIFVNTYGTAANGLTDAEIAVKINELFDLRPAKIIEKFGLKKPIYEPTASYGHVGRDPYKATVMVRKDGQLVPELVQFFGWELLDSVDMIRKAFAL